MDFSFFTTDNKSGYKTKEKWFQKNHEEEYNKIINYCRPYNLKTFKEKIWFYYHQLSGIPKCKTCGTELKFTNRFDRGYPSFCSLTCANDNKEEMVNRISKSINEKWGVDFYPKHKEFIKKQKETKKIRYGNENYNNITKVKKTKKELYGDSGYNNSLKNKITRRESFIETVKTKTKDNFISYDLDDDNITLNCHKCNQNYQIYNNLFNYRSKQKTTICTICNPTDDKQTSGLEKDLTDFLSTFGEVETKNREILNGKEIDVLLPNKKIGLELNGLYWHSELYKGKNYHLDKTILANSKGYDLIHIFEDEWLEKTNIIKSIIKNKLGLNEKTIYARNCSIEKVDKKLTKEFLNKNHIQGYVGSLIAYGLFFDNELVSVMSFGKLRKNLGSNHIKDNYELLRFCNRLNTNVVGGASRLFKHFIKEHSPQKIISFSDNRFFNGNLYRSLNFDLVKKTKPNYYYVINHKRQNRFKYRKDVLVKEGFDKNKTEKEIMLERGYYRIWDCGNLKWEWTTK